MTINSQFSSGSGRTCPDGMEAAAIPLSAAASTLERTAT